MVQRRPRTSETTTKTSTNLQISAPPVLFPGEDEETYESLRDAFLADLAPQSAYERSLVDDLINLEWEKVRHRRLRDRLVLNAARKEVAKVLDPASTAFGALEGPSADARLKAELFVGPDPVERQRVADELRELLREPEEIMALAYRSVSDAVGVHERKLAEIEGRRRKLMRDIQDLRASRAQVVEPAP
jgi:hypothetical protein